jgi:hypothetical protein
MNLYNFARIGFVIAYVAVIGLLLLDNLNASDRIAMNWMNVQIDLYKESLNGEILDLQDPGYKAILKEGIKVANTEFVERFYQTFYLYIIPTVLLLIGWRWCGGKTKK